MPIQTKTPRGLRQRKSLFEMRTTKNTDPATLYRDFYAYVVNCTMAGTRHLSRECAEDIVSDAFLRLVQRNGESVYLGSWIWASRKASFTHYHRSLRYANESRIRDLNPEANYVSSERIEVFRLDSLIKRKDAKRCFYLWRLGYNRAEIAETLGYHKQSVSTNIFRLRKQAKRCLENDIRIYNGRRPGDHGPTNNNFNH